MCPLSDLLLCKKVFLLLCYILQSVYFFISHTFILGDEQLCNSRAEMNVGLLGSELCHTVELETQLAVLVACSYTRVEVMLFIRGVSLPSVVA